MGTLKLRYVERTVAKGRTYYYYRRGGKRIPLKGDPASEEFARGYREAAAPRAPADPESFKALVAAFKTSGEFSALAASTRRAYRDYLDGMAEEFGELPYRSITKGAMLDYRDRFQATPRAADYRMAAVQALLSWAEDRGKIDENPLVRIRRLAKKGEGYRPWTDAEILAFETAAYPELADALHVALYSGQREHDQLAMAWPQYDGSAIEVVQEKTKKVAWIPAHRRLRARLDKMPRRAKTILCTKKGNPWSEDHFRHEVRKTILAAGIAGAKWHGLRKNAVNNLLEGGCSEAETCAITGQTLATMQHYARRVNQRKLALAAIRKLEQKKDVFAKPPLPNSAKIAKPKKITS